MAHPRLSQSLYFISRLHGSRLRQYRRAICHLRVAEGLCISHGFEIRYAFKFKAYSLREVHASRFQLIDNLLRLAYMHHIVALCRDRPLHKVQRLAAGGDIDKTIKYASCQIIDIGIRAHKHGIQILLPHQCAHFILTIRKFNICTFSHHLFRFKK